MNKTSNSLPFAISIAILGFVWLIAVICYTLIFSIPFLCWGSIVFMLFSIGIIEVYLLLIKRNPEEQAAETSAIGLIITYCYYLIAALLNGMFVILQISEFHWAMVLFNVAATAAYCIILIWLERHTAHIEYCLEETEVKTLPFREISRKLGELLSLTEDQEIYAKLLKLKEMVDYSSNISSEEICHTDSQMSYQLDEIMQLTISKADHLIIMNKVNAAETTWKMRTSSMSSSR